MRNKKAFTTIVSLLTVIIMLMCVSMSVYATNEPSFEEPSAETLAPTAEFSEETVPPTDPPTQATEPETEALTEQVSTQQASSSPDSQSKEDSLPQVDIGEIVVPNTIEIPKAEVSDVSLIGGVVSWLCVAVGIAVLAGVLVSQRAKQVNKPSNSRRR